MENQNKNQNTGENLPQEETPIGGASRNNPSKKSKLSTIGLIAIAVVLAVVIAIILNQ